MIVPEEQGVAIILEALLEDMHFTCEICEGQICEALKHADQR